MYVGSKPWCCVCSCRWCVPGRGSFVWWRWRRAGKGKRSSRPPASSELPAHRQLALPHQLAALRHWDLKSHIVHKHTHAHTLEFTYLGLRPRPRAFICERYHLNFYPSILWGHLALNWVLTSCHPCQWVEMFHFFSIQFNLIFLKQVTKSCKRPD